MSKLVNILKTIGKYELAVNEVNELIAAYKKRKRFSDIGFYPDKIVDVAARYGGLVFQGAAASSAYFGVLTPQQAASHIIHIEEIKLITHGMMKGLEAMLNYTFKNKQTSRIPSY